MERSKEYFLKLSEQIYNELGNDEKSYLNHLGLQVKQKATAEDMQDEKYKKVRNARLKAYNDEQEFLFKKRNN